MRKFSEFSEQFLLLIIVGIIGIHMSIVLGYYILALITAVCLSLVCLGAAIQYMDRLNS